MPTLVLSVLMLSACQDQSVKPGEHQPELVNNQVEVSQQPSVIEQQSESDSIAIEPALPEIKPDPVTLEMVQPLFGRADGDLWRQLAFNFTLATHTHQARVKNQVNWYAKHPAYLNRVSDRASPYLFHVAQMISDRKLPPELALLPIVESAFDPFAYSFGRASGIWQFIPGTARHYGLEQDWWIDERRDIHRSTDAALTYLEYLHGLFDDDWLLALAAYNSGQGTVLRAIRKNKKLKKPTDFWHLQLPKETRHYVPKLLALAELVKNQKQYNLKIKSVPNQVAISRIKLDYQLDIAQAAELSGLTIDEVYRYNPSLNQWATPPGKGFGFMLPKTKKDAFVAALKKLPKKQRVSWKRYTIKSGDSLLRIAKRQGLTVKLIQQVNGLSGNNIRAGQKLMLPSSALPAKSYVLSADQRLKKIQNRRRGSIKLQHIVKSGDTLWDLSRKYKTSTSRLAKWNGISPKDALKLGQKLVIWKATKKSTRMRKVTYTVRNGDSLARIANKFKVKISQIKLWNPKVTGKYIQPGQRVKLYVDVLKQTSKG